MNEPHKPAARLPEQACSAVLAMMLLWSAVAGAASTLHMDVGEMSILTPGAVERVAVGNSGVISTSLIGNGQLLVFAEQPGLTTLHVWLTDGKEVQWKVQVDAAEYQAGRLTDTLDAKHRDVKKLLGGITGLEIRKVGSRIVLTGVYGGQVDVVRRVKEAFPEILDLTVTGQSFEVTRLVEGIRGLDVKVVGTRVVLTGEVDKIFEENIKTIQGAYPDVMDLTRKTESLELSQDKMVLMHITITEFNRNFLETLGINWTRSFNGPSAALAAEAPFGRSSQNVGASVLSSESVPGIFSAAAPGSASAAFGYFGIASEIVSRINLAVDSGNAVVLAEPRLVARSKGEATFLAGGEIPIKIVTANTTEVQFKKFGILLEIKPEVDRLGNIKATVSTEISSVDQSVQVEGTPGFKTRQTKADVSLQSGDTLVLSGLVDRSASEQVNKLAGLGDIPVLGRLFRSTQFTENKTELVIFVTPYVYDAKSPQNVNALKRQNELVKEFADSLENSKLKLLD